MSLSRLEQRMLGVFSVVAQRHGPHRGAAALPPPTAAIGAKSRGPEEASAAELWRRTEEVGPCIRLALSSLFFLFLLLSIVLSLLPPSFFC